MKQGVRFDKIVGTGGIGTGLLFLSEQAGTLGRSESRSVTLSDAKDYCKQHIVLHYAAALTRGVASVIPIGFVGSDAAGRDLLATMSAAGLDTAHVGVSEEYATMISVCLQYPDKEGCNITAMNNAASRVTPEFVRNCMESIPIDGSTIVAAMPEVSIESRLALLGAGKRKMAFTALSIPASEAAEFLESDIFPRSDLIAVNEEEGQALLGQSAIDLDLARLLYAFLRDFNPGIWLLVTCGKHGAYSVDRGYIERIPPLPVKAVNTAGAGDAFLGGTLAGLARGLPFQKRRIDRRFGETRLESAAELGAICAGMSVEVQDSIAAHVTLESIQKRISGSQWEAELGL